jgi:Beta-propeller repeat
MPEARFLSRTAEYTLLLAQGQATLLFPQFTSSSQRSIRNLRMELVGAQPTTQLEGIGELPGKSNYFIGKDSANWQANIPHYAQVKYKSVYPGIDLVFHGNGGELEYDFQLAAGADPKLIDLRIDGTDQIQVDRAGNLLLRVDHETIRLGKPNVYQEADGVRREVTGNFVLRRKNNIGFRLDRYDTRLPLVIDPVLTYGILLSANNNTQAQGMAIDSSGDMYITGTTFATNYPTVSAFQTMNKGTTNVFITKLGPSGNQILYSTYLGGSGFDTGRAIAVDSAGNAYVTGNPDSSDFPTTPGALMTTCPGICNTPFVAKILPNGSLGFSTFTGGSNVAAWSIAVDSAEATYITGSAASGDLPLVNPFQTNPAGAFVQKLNPTGTALEYSTYLGGGGDWGRSIAVDSADSAYVVGSTTAPNFPVKNALQPSQIGGDTMNAFITKFSPDGGSLVYSTYYGGSSQFFFSFAGDAATGVIVDAFGNAHVTGTSSSCEFPLSLNAFSTNCVNISNDQ